MSFFDGDLDLEGVDEFREMLEELAYDFGGPKATHDLLERISDDVFSELGKEAIDEGRSIPLKANTLRGKDTFFHRSPPKRQTLREKNPKLFSGKNPSTTPLAQSPGGDGLVSALTAPFILGKGSRSAERYILGDTLYWGTKGKINYAHPHVFGSRRGLPARLAKLQPKNFSDEAADRIKDIMAEWLGAKLERAGAPTSLIQELTEGRF